MSPNSVLPPRAPSTEANRFEAYLRSKKLKLTGERKRITDLVKMVAYQIESDLVAVVTPHYARAEDEGRTLIQNILASAADLDIAQDELRVKVAPLSSPHRTRRKFLLL